MVFDSMFIKNCMQRQAPTEYREIVDRIAVICVRFTLIRMILFVNLVKFKAFDQVSLF